jgi:hypothetical protein
LLFSGCRESKDAVVPESGATGVADAKDDKYKKDKTGQYVDKSVQVTGYEDGRERHIQPKYNFLPETDKVTPTYIEPCDQCDVGGGGSVNNTAFTSSVGLGAFSGILLAIFLVCDLS